MMDTKIPDSLWSDLKSEGLLHPDAPWSASCEIVCIWCVAMIREVLPSINYVKFETIPASELTLALQCGGSGGYSGNTVNPELGRLPISCRATVSPQSWAKDRKYMVRNICWPVVWSVSKSEKNFSCVSGVENSRTSEMAAKWTRIRHRVIKLVPWRQSYKKSLGSIAKGRTTELCDLFQYGEPVTCMGMVIMGKQWYVIAFIMGPVSGGANNVCFTTGWNGNHRFHHQLSDSEKNSQTYQKGNNPIVSVPA